jgi:hypothetical protein
MSIYDVTYNSVDEKLSPFGYRGKSIFQKFLNVLTYPLQWLRDIFFDYYMDSATLAYYKTALDGTGGAATIAMRGDVFRFIDNTVWECQTDGTALITDNPLLLPTSVNWLQFTQDCVGLNERIKYSSQKLLLEYILDRYFNPSGYIALSGHQYAIWIENLHIDNLFFIGEKFDGMGSAVISQDYLYGSPDPDALFFISESDDMATEGNKYTFEVHIPTAIATDLGTDYIDIISEIVNRYKNVGTTFIITTY